MGSQQLGVLGFSLLILACSTALAQDSTAQCADPTTVHLAVFGDSLTDQGRLWRLSNKTIPRADLGYYNGRFTNAYGVWLDYLKGWTEDKTAYTNFAFGGAFACDYPGPRPQAIPSLTQQIGIHLSRLPTSGYKSLLANKQRGAIIWTGHNDLFFFAPQLLRGELNATAFVQNVVGCIIAGSQALMDAGEQKVVIGTTAPIARTPAAQNEIPAAALPIFSGILDAYNKLLAQAVQQLNAAKQGSGKGVYLWDAFTELNAAFETFECYGFKTLEGCIKYAPGQGAFQRAEPTEPVCTNPNERVFWDAFHPSSRAHKRIIAHSIKRKLASLDLI